MKNLIFAFSLFALCFLAGCNGMTLEISEEIQDSQMAGTYFAKYPSGSAVLKLFKNHTLQQSVFENNGKKYSANGKWELSKDGDTYRLNLSNGWFPIEGGGPITHSGLNTFLYKSGGSISITVDVDAGIEFTNS